MARQCHQARVVRGNEHGSGMAVRQGPKVADKSELVAVRVGAPEAFRQMPRIRTDLVLAVAEADNRNLLARKCTNNAQSRLSTTNHYRYYLLYLI